MTRAAGRRNVLFVTWDGPGSPFLEGLFLPIFEALRTSDYDFHVLQFTWAEEVERRRLHASSAALGIPYRSVAIWRRPIALGSMLTALNGALPLRRAIKDWRIDIVMPRSTLPATAARGATMIGAGRLPMLLDADGLPHDERVELGQGNRRDGVYRVLRRLETQAVLRADSISVRSRRAADILTARAGDPGIRRRFHVVANARDAALFRPLDDAARTAVRSRIGVTADQPLLVFAASALGWKNRTDAMLRLFAAVCARRADARLLLLLPDHRETGATLAAFPEIAESCILRSAAPGEVAQWIGAADLGLALMHASFSMQAVAPIKIGEYLLCGVPVLTSRGIGDFDSLIGSDTGLCLGETDDAALQAAADWFVGEVIPRRAEFAERCRALGLRHFSLESAVAGYCAALDAAVSNKR
ncbi:hypothetical protein [Sphingomonas mesophila]|uniref:hypothetical protein n=1 Tax=Sphingomonas mesophila TaxID=2303576 RepID=UPI000E584686|nr:hypothetical protein [Sphingomonas mesophila]